MEFIGKLDGMPVFEINRGNYIAVDAAERKYYTMWCWFANLGKWNDSFEKCSFCDDEELCLDIIEENIKDITEKMNGYQKNIDSEDGQKFLEEQDNFYQWLESNREYNWFDGYTDEEEREDSD